MHYRRMDPQPPGGAVTRVYELHTCPPIAVFCIGEHWHAQPPDDMWSAEPWRASDDEWFWRRALQ